MASSTDIRKTERMAIKVRLILDEFPYDELTERELANLYDDLTDLRDTLSDLLDAHNDIETLDEIECREYWNNVLDGELRRNR